VSGIPIEVGVVDLIVFRQVQRGWQVLALERAPGVRCPGAWEMVHGKVEPGERLEQAALRELREETGLAPQRLLSIKVHPFYVVPTGTVQLAAVFAAIVAPEGVVKLAEEHTRHAWLTPSQAKRRFVWPHERRVVDEARHLLGAREVHDVLAIQVIGER
jgi:dATP pyrophosphohydrolase